MKKEEERVCETMINGYLCALSHYNVRNITLQCTQYHTTMYLYMCTGVNVTIMLRYGHTLKLYNDDCTDNAAMTKDKH